MKTESEILATLEAIQASLPKSGPAPERVLAAPLSAAAGRLRVVLENANDPRCWDLIGEWGHGVCGWIQIEHAACLGPEKRQVERAVRKALKANP